jgi:hypothetical protein
MSYGGDCIPSTGSLHRLTTPEIGMFRLVQAIGRFQIQSSDQ